MGDVANVVLATRIIPIRLHHMRVFTPEGGMPSTEVRGDTSSTADHCIGWFALEATELSSLRIAGSSAVTRIVSLTAELINVLSEGKKTRSRCLMNLDDR